MYINFASEFIESTFILVCTSDGGEFLLKCTYAGKRGRNERPTVGVPVGSCPGARDPVASDVTGSGRLPVKLDCDVDVGDEERIAQILGRTRRTLDCSQQPSIHSLTYLLIVIRRKKILCFDFQLPSVPKITSIPKIFIGPLRNTMQFFGVCFQTFSEKKLFASSPLRCSIFTLVLVHG